VPRQAAWRALQLAARNDTVADAIARAVAAFDPSLVLVGLAGSALISAGARAGLRTASEVFADRGYRADGTLAPRDQPGGVIHDPDAVVPRVLAMIREGAVTAVDGSQVSLQAETICLHGDTPGAAHLASRIRQALVDAGVELRAL
jgi:5-oxoprolinase (ATP-hydrolysing) subunit A